MRYVALGIILLFGACSLTTRTTSTKEPVKPTLVAPENAGVIDRNNDGLVTGAEIDAVSNNPSALTVFLWLVFAVLLSIGLTMILGRFTPTKPAKVKIDNAALLKARAAIRDKEHKPTIKTAPPFYKTRDSKDDK